MLLYIVYQNFFILKIVCCVSLIMIILNLFSISRSLHLHRSRLLWPLLPQSKNQDGVRLERTRVERDLRHRSRGVREPPHFSLQGNGLARDAVRQAHPEVESALAGAAVDREEPANQWLCATHCAEVHSL